MTPEQMTERSSKLLEQFDGLDTGNVITILATALQMAVCYGAQEQGRRHAHDLVPDGGRRA